MKKGNNQSSKEIEIRTWILSVLCFSSNTHLQMKSVMVYFLYMCGLKVIFLDLGYRLVLLMYPHAFANCDELFSNVDQFSSKIFDVCRTPLFRPTRLTVGILLLVCYSPLTVVVMIKFCPYASFCYAHPFCVS